MPTHPPPKIPIIHERDVHDIILSYLETYGAVRYQKESFDHFITCSLPHIIQENSDIRILHPDRENRMSTFSFCNVRVTKPGVIEKNGMIKQLTPMEARLRGITYGSAVFVDVHERVVDAKDGKQVAVDTKHYSNMQIAEIPIMVGTSKCYLNNHASMESHAECVYDEGGYFIVNGVEKGFVSQEKLRINYPFVFPVRSESKPTIACEIRSCHDKKLRSTSTLYITGNLGKSRKDILSISVTVPFVTQPLSLSNMFGILGVTTVSEIRRMLIYVDDSATLKTTINAFLDRIDEPQCDLSLFVAAAKPRGVAGKPIQRGTPNEIFSHEHHILTNEVLPHLGLDTSEQTQRRKAWFLAYSCRRIFRAMIKEINYDNRDHYQNKRVDTAGALMSLLFRQLFRVFIKYASSQLSRHITKDRIENIMTFITHKKITSGIRYAFTTGNWGVQKSTNTQTGVLQVLNRMTLISPISNLQRINTPICREGKASGPRQLHHSSWGIVCIAETPEGVSCGLMKNLCNLANIRIGIDTDDVWGHIVSIERPHGHLMLGIPPPDVEHIMIFINGQCLAYVYPDEAVPMVTRLRRHRRAGGLPDDTSIALDLANQCIQITTDRGALTRPVFVVENLHKLPAVLDRHRGVMRKFVWGELISLGVIEYLIKEEEAEMRIAVQLKEVDPLIHTHVELHPTLINGLCAAQIPFSDHNQSPRNCYQSAMGKQAIGIYASNYMQRMDNVAHVLTQPQRPLVTTWINETMKTSNMPSGANAIVAIMCWSGYNQEDSVIINKTALDNGMLSTMLYRTYKDDILCNAGDYETVERPVDGNCSNIRLNDYSKLTPDAMVSVGTSLCGGDVIIGKTVTSRQNQGGKVNTRKRDQSTYIKHSEDAIVDAVFSVDNETHQTVKVRTRQMRKPQTGDKLASRHGQKGVIGIIYKEADLPFTAEGLRPDIIVNPHAIPSRMTIGMLMEMLLGKECLISGNFGDGTPFRDMSEKQIGDELEKRGLCRSSTDTMFNAFTGEAMESKVFIAPAYYQRLKHMVVDKIHSRARGPVQLLTRQPNEGRSRDGGLRFGEMERDCILAHGCALAVRECLFEKSDPYATIACKACGLLAEHFHNQHPLAPGQKAPIGYCRACKTSEHATVVRIPYAMKLLLQELQALHIAARFRFDDASSADNGVSTVRGVNPVFEFY